MIKLNDSQVKNRLASLSNWKLEQSKLHREYQFRDFKTAFSFISDIAALAEQMQHHPEWSNVYSKVKIDLCTHDVGGISEQDFIMAEKMEQSASQWKASH